MSCALAPSEGVPVQAWRVHDLGEPTDVMSLDRVDDPRSGPGESLVRVETASLNFPDLLVCRGDYQERPQHPFTPGLEVCGTLVGGPRAGERVAALTTLPAGGLAELVVVGDESVFAVPASMPSAKVAALLGTYLTSHAGLHRRARLAPGETLLVHAGAGGVGSAAIQLGKAAGAYVIATAGGPEKVEVCRRLGADLALDYVRDDFVARVKEATQGRGADVIYDPVGGDVFDRSRKCIAFEGRLLVVGFAGGRIAEAPTNHALIKNYSVVGLHFGLYRERRPDVVRQIHSELVDLWSRGLIDPLVEPELAFEQVPEGLQRLGGRGTVGKIVVRVAPHILDSGS
jgi:NADPH2:quinone reductase